MNSANIFLLVLILLIVLCFTAVFFYVRLLKASLELAGLENRTIEPSFLWILMFPFVGVGWNIQISYQVVVSLRAKIEKISNWRSTKLLLVLAVSHSFVFTTCVIAMFFTSISEINWVLFPLSMMLLAGWIWELIRVNKFIRLQSEQN